MCVCVCVWKDAMLYKHETNSQENNHAEVSSQQSRFKTLLKSHSHTNTPLNLWETAFVKRVLKVINYCKKLLLTVVKKNLFTQKVNK